jgi:hypothetical protein
MMPYNLGAIVFGFAVLAVLAMLVKHERRLKRWLLKSPRRQKRKPKTAGIPYTMLP